jgi:putative PIN family toxin of toxin-antitoxin system
MKVMIDTNIFVSAILYNSQYLMQFINKIANEHTLVLYSYITDELYKVALRKKPDKKKEMEKFLSVLPHVQIESPEHIPENERLFQIRDEDDYIILHTAITEGVDVLITNDKDFCDVNIKRPQILSPIDFMQMH